MINPVNISKIYSTLGSNSSVVPLAVKDIANSLGITAGAYVVGKKEESADRFLDEFGTQAIWLFEIPLLKNLIDLTVYKPLKVDNKIDVRIFKDKEVFEKAKEFAPTPEIKSALIKAEKNTKFMKGLALAKFAISTGLTIYSYSALTKYRHKKTEEKVRKTILKEQEQKRLANGENFAGSSNADKPAFKGGLSEFMFNPVKNLMVLDGAISLDRFYRARSLQDFLGYVVKEGTFWTFMYFASQRIQKSLENKALKEGKTISIDSRVIENPDLKKSIANGELQKALNDFGKNKTNAQIYEFLNTAPDNIVVKFAKQSDIVKTLETNDGFWNKLARKIGLKSKLQNADKIDTRAFIDMDELKKFVQKLQNIENQYKNSGESIDTFCKKLVSLKRNAVLKGIGACIFALGVLTPTIMVTIRLLRHDKGFQVREKIEQELAQNLSAAA